MIDKLLNIWFSLKLNSNHIDKVLHKLKSEPPPVRSGKNISKKVHVSCIQRELKLVSSVKAYIHMMDALVAEAVRQESRLVIFPEYNFFDLFGMIPCFKLVDRYLSGRAKIAINSTKPQITERNEEAEGEEATDQNNSLNPILYKIFNATSVPLETALLYIMSGLAARYDIFIYSGTYISRQNGNLYNAGTLFGPEGKPLVTQNKINLTEFESDIGLTSDNKLQVFPLFNTKAAMPICMDATYFEVFHAARSAGADMVILPIANLEEYSLWKSLRGIWSRVQESYVFGLKSALTGWIAGMHFTGKAGIFAPVLLTSDGKGVIALSPDSEGNSVVSGDLDFTALEELRNISEYYGDSNPEFERNYIKNTYHEGVGNEQITAK
jgi:Predicted amidohydrolase